MLWQELEGLLIHVKLARPLSAVRNCPDVIQKRLDYECGYNVWTESLGRARREEQANRQVCGQQKRNVTVTVAISLTNGLVFCSVMG